MKNQNPQFTKTSADDLRLAFGAFLKVYAPDSQANDTLLALFEKQFRKPISVKVQTHWNRCDLIMNYINQLQGEVTQELIETQRKMIFYNIFPVKYRNAFATSKDL